MTISTATPPRLQIEYPESDGKPMAETDTHIQQLIDTREALKYFFRDDPLVYVAGNLLLYYVEGDPSLSVAPDVFVVKGVAKGDRRTYKLWVEKRPPLVVFEFSSRATWLEDTGNKKALYAILGVREYFLCDPLAEYLEPPLQGFALEHGDYQRMAAESDGSLVSRELGLRLKLEVSSLRLSVTVTGERLLTPAEAMEKARSTEAEIERLKAELARLRGE